MKLLLTSNGLVNSTIAHSLDELTGKPLKKTRIAYIPTAGLTYDGEISWLINNLAKIKEWGYHVYLVDISRLSFEETVDRIRGCDALCVGGGDTFYLSYWMQKCGLLDILSHLLKDIVYVGICAGSMLMTPGLELTYQAIYTFTSLSRKELAALGPVGHSSDITANIVPFMIRPHFGRSDRPDITENFLQNVASNLSYPVYAIDDQSAIIVDNNTTSIASEGRWLKLGS